MKNLLILKAHHDICGDEVGLITHQSQFLEITVFEHVVNDEQEIVNLFEGYEQQNQTFDYVYLCTHANSEEFEIDQGNSSVVTWARFGQIVCESGTLNDNTIFLLACCRGGLFKVATDLFAVCNKINFVCGAKWKLRGQDLVTGFMVFLYNIQLKLAEPSYAATKASLATDYTFYCHDRSEIESHPQYENRRWQLYINLGWADQNGEWVEEDETIKENAGIQ